MEPTRQTVRGILSPGRAAHLNRSTDNNGHDVRSRRKLGMVGEDNFVSTGRTDGEIC